MPATQPIQQRDPTVGFFDNRAEDYDREYEQPTPGGYALRVRREKVLQLLDLREGKVLDIGCGPGAMAREIVNRGCTFWGIDPSRNMVEIGRRRFDGGERTQFCCGDAMQLPLPECAFDAVLCMGVIDGLRDRPQAIREMMRVLRPGGTLIVTFANFASPYSWWKKYIFYPLVASYQRLLAIAKPGGRRFRAVPDAKQRKLYSRRALRSLLETEGAEVLRIAGYYYNIFLSPLDEIFPSGALRVTRKFERGEWPTPEWIAAGWIVKARKADRG